MNITPTCIGSYYNSKMGRETCRHKADCPHYEVNLIDNIIKFDNVKQFRNCNRHLASLRLPKKQEFSILCFFEHPRNISFSNKNIFRDLREHN